MLFIGGLPDFVRWVYTEVRGAYVSDEVSGLRSSDEIAVEGVGVMWLVRDPSFGTLGVLLRISLEVCAKNF